MSAQPVPRWRGYLSDLLTIVVPGLLLLLVLVVAHYRITLEQASQLMLAQEQATTELTRQLMRTRLNEMMADVKVLADTVSSQATGPERTQLTASFLQLARHKPGYSQLRFIDSEGMEVVRVNNGPSPHAVALDQLQNKAGRYYVAQSQNLPPGQVYISRFDLNMEQGQLQHSQPTLRVAAPVIARQGERRGIVVLNLSGEQLVEQVWGQAPIGADAIVLVSGHGYSLVRPKAQQGRVQFFPDNPLAEHSPQLWRKLNAATQGQFIQDDQLYAYASLVIPQAQGNARWKIFTLRDGSALGAVKRRFGWHNLPLYGLLALTLCVVALVNAQHRRRHQQVMAHTAYERSFRLLLEQSTRERVRHEQLAAVGRMASMVAHDLRNPLSSVKVGLQMTSRKPDLDAESREICQISLDQVRHMEGILEDLLAYSRPDALSLEWLNVNQLLEQVVMGQLRLIKDRNVFIDRDFDPRLPTLNADPVKLRQALQNLVVNAIDAAQGEGNQLARVSLKTRLIFTDHGLKVALTISNNGGSIDPCMCLKVFEPFFTTKAKGTGLGLAIVQRIVQQHRGRVTLAPAHAPQEGTRACVILPLDQLTDQTR